MSDKPVMYFAGGCVLIIAVVLVLLGLLFMVGSQGRVGTAGTGLIMLLLGLAAGVFTVRKLGHLLAGSPDSVDERVLQLAAMSGGEITAAEATGTLNVPLHAVQQSLDRLVGKGLAELKVRGDAVYYAFAGLVEVRKVKRCAYCGTHYPVREPGFKCPSCGGTLEIVDAPD